MKYQGWSNWDTWVIALWLDNREDLYKNFQLVIDDVELCNWFLEVVKDERLDNPKSPFSTDMNKVDFSLVNWTEILKHK